MTYDGILLIDKPVGWSSFDVVAKVRSTLSRQYLDETGQKKKIKVGHTGTLDPLASGLMIIVVGSYCKRASEFSKLDKVYDVQMVLGQTSTTGDEEGEKTTISANQPDDVTVQNAVCSFVGKSLQTPPVFSAIKVNGQRAYDLARAGKAVELEPRPIEIYDISMTAYEYPKVHFLANVSSGTYIRSLVVDIGTKLKTGAYMTLLNRVSIANFTLEDAIAIENVSPDKIRQIV